MAIPNNVFSPIIAMNVPVKDIIRVTNLPRFTADITPDSTCLQTSFFSKNLPTTLLPDWHIQEILPLQLAFPLAAKAEQAWVEGYQSIRHWREKELHLPLWIIHWWLRVGLLQICRSKWIEGIQNLKLAKAAIEGDSVAETNAYLVETGIEQIGWGVQLDGYAREGAMASIDIVALLGNGWLNDRHMDALYAGLKHRVSQSPHSDKIHIGTLSAFQALLRGRWENYGKTFLAPFRSLWNLGQLLHDRSIEKLYFPIHAYNNHFQAVCIDSINRHIFYGCGLDWAMPKLNRNSLDRWLCYHGFESPKITTLPHPVQDDSYSCGWISLSITEHDIFGDKLWTSDRKVAYKLDKIESLLESHFQVRIMA